MPGTLTTNPLLTGISLLCYSRQGGRGNSTACAKQVWVEIASYESHTCSHMLNKRVGGFACHIAMAPVVLRLLYASVAIMCQASHPKSNHFGRWVYFVRQPRFSPPPHPLQLVRRCTSTSFHLQFEEASSSSTSSCSFSSPSLAYSSCQVLPAPRSS